MTPQPDKRLAPFKGTPWARELAVELKPVPIRRRTGFEGARWRGAIELLRRGYYWVTTQTVAGEAPKDFIRVYEPRHCRRSDPSTWPAFIAKVGHKWYPAESITEQLLTRVGQALGFRMADSKLMHARDQIRFLSRYFLEDDESLVHGAEVVAGYLVDDAFVEQVGDEHLEKEIFTFHVLCDAVRARFPEQADSILLDFIELIAFDTLVGNQDRHLYNWGVVVHPEGKRPPRFSPIYDTARGLFWNTAEERLQDYGTAARLEKYVARAQPLIGWEGAEDVNHFELVRRVAECNDTFRRHLQTLPRGELRTVLAMIDDEFGKLLSRPRRELIKECLQLRARIFAEILRD